MMLSRRTAWAVIVGCALVVLQCSSAYALPSLQLYRPAPASSGGPAGLPTLGQDFGDNSTLGGSGSFGSTIQNAQGNISLVQLPVAGVSRHDNYRRAHYRNHSEAPEPGSIWVFGAGLALIAFIALRKRQTR